MKLNKPVVCCIGSLLAQFAFAQRGTDWDVGAYGIRFSIALKSPIIVAGTTNAIQCCITNSFTNTIRIYQPIWEGTALSLSNRAGKVYGLTPPPITEGSSAFAGRVEAGAIREWSALLRIPESFEPGDYELRAVRHIFIPLGMRKVTAGDLVSNPVQVKVEIR